MTVQSPLSLASAETAPAVPVSVAFGDGIGPEIMEASLRVLAAAGANLLIEEVELGEKVYLAGHSAGVTAESWDSIRRTKVFYKAPITTPQGGGYKSLNVTVRKSLGLFANVRPCRGAPAPTSGAGDRHDRRQLLGCPRARQRLGPDCRSSGAADTNDAHGSGQLRASISLQGMEPVPTLAPTHGGRSSASLASRMRGGRMQAATSIAIALLVRRCASIEANGAECPIRLASARTSS